MRTATGADGEALKERSCYAMLCELIRDVSYISRGLPCKSYDETLRVPAVPGADNKDSARWRSAAACRPPRAPPSLGSAPTNHPRARRRFAPRSAAPDRSGPGGGARSAPGTTVAPLRTPPAWPAVNHSLRLYSRGGGGARRDGAETKPPSPEPHKRRAGRVRTAWSCANARVRRALFLVCSCVTVSGDLIGVV